MTIIRGPASKSVNPLQSEVNLQEETFAALLEDE
jgi:hypothetical protein